jgi:hypothetical protein
LERFACNKHSVLFLSFLNYGCKMFYKFCTYSKFGSAQLSDVRLDLTHLNWI